MIIISPRAINATGQYLLVIFMIELKKRGRVIFPSIAVTAVAANINMAEIKKKFFLEVSSKKSIRKLIPAINSTDGKIISLSFKNSK